MYIFLSIGSVVLKIVISADKANMQN
jgi:hypothetical protein